MFRFLSLAILALFFAEIAGFIVVGRVIGVFPVLGLTVLAGFLGIQIIRQSGFKIANLGRTTQIDAKQLSEAAAGGLLGSIAGLLLIFPGFVTDFMGLLLLLPPVRQYVASKMKASAGPLNPNRSNRYGPVIEGESSVIEPEVTILPPRRDD